VPSTSEIVNLLLIVVLAPVTVIAVRQLTHPGRWWMLYGFLGIAAGGVLAVVEGLAPWLAWATYPKGICHAFAGIAYAVGLSQLSSAMRRREFL
jgi:hypothetical protein